MLYAQLKKEQIFTQYIQFINIAISIFYLNFINLDFFFI